jgi:hypothetical protein
MAERSRKAHRVLEDVRAASHERSLPKELSPAAPCLSNEPDEERVRIRPVENSSDNPTWQVHTGPGAPSS